MDKEKQMNERFLKILEENNPDSFLLKKQREILHKKEFEENVVENPNFSKNSDPQIFPNFSEKKFEKNSEKISGNFAEKISEKNSEKILEKEDFLMGNISEHSRENFSFEKKTDQSPKNLEKKEEIFSPKKEQNFSEEIAKKKIAPSEEKISENNFVAVEPQKNILKNEKKSLKLEKIILIFLLLIFIAIGILFLTSGPEKIFENSIFIKKYF